jgi:hypothetical protein
MAGGLTDMTNYSFGLTKVYKSATGRVVVSSIGYFLLSVFVTGFLAGCHNIKADQPQQQKLFTLLSSATTKVDFNNKLTEGLNTNILMYEYFYNGGGVAIGDLNNDGLEDIYFTANMEDNKLYMNAGGLKFEDITAEAGVAGRRGPWKTGVTMVDINGDQRLDIYVCYSGKLSGSKRTNQLFINEGAGADGIPHFTEQAGLYGVADSAYTTHAVFFDYDRDTDLDLLLLNHNPKRINNLNDFTIAHLLKDPSSTMGMKLLRNNKNHFEDVTEDARLLKSSLSYGLGISVSDVNSDGWPDIYLSNDYDVPDYLYINNGNGTFTDRLGESIGHTSHFSMGNNIADINNDALPDIYTLDMLPEDNHRQKLLFSPDNYAAFDLKVRVGFHNQYMRNMFHVNNGDGTFSEIGHLSGISNTDWSWAPLFADFDNDGWKDLFVTNGFVRDFTNMDFVRFVNDRFASGKEVWRKDLLEIVQQMPSSDVVNYIFKNKDGLTFENMNPQWGIEIASNSNGAAWADLDNDGDLDLVVNNINREAFIYRNESNKFSANHYLKINLNGAGLNTGGFGAKVTIYRGRKIQYLEQMPSRGYQSAVSPTLHFGLGEDPEIDSLKIIWQDGKQQLILNPPVDQLLTLRESNAAKAGVAEHVAIVPLFEEIKFPLLFEHQTDNVNDFKRQPLMVNPQSFAGPCMAKGDVNNDGLEDIYVGGGVDQSGALFLQQKSGSYIKQLNIDFEKDNQSDDTDATFFDANNDGFIDLYVCSGGYHHYLPDDAALQDRLYLNDGTGNFKRDHHALPELRVSKSCVRVSDINDDGYPDLFVGGRVIPGRYPETPSSYLLRNDGHGKFIDVTSSLAPVLRTIGMVTDAVWTDLNNDHKEDLILVGEWMPVTVLLRKQNTFVDHTLEFFENHYSGWWNKILADDFNGDGKVDLVIGNHGLNSQCTVSDAEPAELYYGDFDKNGSVDPFLCFYIQHKSYPYVTRDELIEQLGMMRSRYPNYATYADASITDIFTSEELRSFRRLNANLLETSYFESTSNGKFIKRSLPVQAQYAPIFSFLSIDYNQDGFKDLLLCGNSTKARLRFGSYDANHGILLTGDGTGKFSYVSQHQSSFHLKGDVRSILEVDNTLFFGINQKPVQAYRLKNHKSSNINY